MVTDSLEQLLVTGTSQQVGFQNPYKQRATFSVSSLLSVLEPCPEEYDVNHGVNVFVWTRVMTVTMAIMSIF